MFTLGIMSHDVSFTVVVPLQGTSSTTTSSLNKKATWKKQKNHCHGPLDDPQMKWLSRMNIVIKSFQTIWLP